jgi:predicted PurR-regulated permease PerM
MSDAKLEAYFFTAILLAVLTLVGIIFYPFIGSLVLAIVLATLVGPFHARVSVYVKNQSVSAMLVTVAVTLAIIVPAIGLFFLLVDEIKSVTEQLATYQFNLLPSSLSAYQAKIAEFIPFTETVRVSDLLQSTFQYFGTHLGTAVTSTTGFIFRFFISLIALYYFIKDGKKFLQEIVSLSPLSDVEDASIIKKLNTVTHSLIRGTLVIAILQGLLTGFGFLLFGIPNPVLWGSFAAIGALIPTLGTGIVSLPAIIFLFVTGQIVPAIGLTAWATLIVGLVDNIIGPKLIGRGSKIHPLFILISVLGGLAVFGISGFLLGPLTFGFLVALSEIYKVKISEIHKNSC